MNRMKKNDFVLFPHMSLEKLPMLTSSEKKLLSEQGFHTLDDILFTFPIRYEDWREPVPIRHIEPFTTVLVQGKITSIERKRTPRKRMRMYTMTIHDGTGTLLLIFFHKSYWVQGYTEGDEVLVYGHVEVDRRTPWMPQMTHPKVLLLTAAQKRKLPGRVVPVYRKNGKVTSYRFEKIIHRILFSEVELYDPLPRMVIKKNDFPSRKEALQFVHNPPHPLDMESKTFWKKPAIKRLIYEDFFLLQAGLLLRKRFIESKKTSYRIEVTEAMKKEILELLPFELTRSQKRVLDEILQDLTSTRPMHRLLQGDVGSGKTILALLAMYLCVRNGYQACLMAPTEILAEQHHYTFKKFFKHLDIPVVKLIGSLRTADRRVALQWIRSGHAPIIVGTHALFQEGVQYARLGLVVIDEQHRFGVHHRALLRKKGHLPHTLVMTATPIPRSLALTWYGDLDVSILDELPPGRQKVRTILKSTTHRSVVYSWVASKLAEGHQAYIVCPLIEESEKLQVQAATSLYEKLKRLYFNEFEIALVHGRIKPQEREVIMEAFHNGHIRALIATTVIEVGVDNPNATIMVIEHAERFGLAQLHQLRGRVGRGREKSYCILMAPPKIGRVARQRLKVLLKYSDGFKISEYDLKLRGPGELAGVRQSGLGRLRIGDIVRDAEYIPFIRKDAEEFVQNMIQRKGIGSKEVRAFLRYWVEHYGLSQVG